MAIERDLRARGGVAVQSADADVIVVNSCSVTATADQGTRQAIRRAARDNPRARIVVTGCYATRCPDEVAALPGVVAVVPNSEKETLVASGASVNTASGTVPNAFTWGQSPRVAVRRPRWMSSVFPARPDGVHAARADWLRRAVQLLHHPDDARTVGEQADRRDRARAEAGGAVRLPRGHADGRAPRCLRAGPHAARDAGHVARGRDRRDGQRAAAPRFARAHGRARDARRSDRHRPPRACVPSAAAARERRGAGADAPPVHARRLPPHRGPHCAIDCRMPRSAPTSSSGSPARPMQTSIGSVVISSRARSRRCTCSRTPIVLAPRRRRSPGKCPVRSSRSAGAWCATSASRPGRAIPRRAGRHATSRADDRGRIGRHHRQRTPRPNRAGPPAERANPRCRGFLTPPVGCTLLRVNSHGSPETPPARPRVCATAMQARLPDPILTVDPRAAPRGTASG